MAKCKRGYKICRVTEDGQFTSAIIWNDGNTAKEKASVTYKKNRCVSRHPLCGPLAVFNTAQDASNFVAKCPDDWKYGHKYAIFACSYVESVDKDMWFDDNGIKRVKKSCNIPYGTSYADKVVLKEAISYFTRETRSMVEI